jgi:hypothetical protein
MKPHSTTRAGTKVFHLPAASYETCGRKPHRQPQLHIAGESLDWAWLEADRQLVYQMWREGVPGQEICERVGRYWLEVLVLIDEGISDGLIEHRDGGFAGAGRRVESTAKGSVEDARQASPVSP